jgi:competence protein CoiA
MAQREKKDAAPFKKGYIGGQTPDLLSPNKSRVFFPKGALFRDWAESPGHVFLDFGDEHPLWWIFPGSNETYVYVQSISRIEFTQSLQEKSLSAPNGFDSLVTDFGKFIVRCEARSRITSHSKIKRFIEKQNPHHF